MNKVKTISASVTDIANLLTIDDPEARRAAYDAILSAAEAPDSIPEKSSGIADPILNRIRRKAIAQKKAEARKAKKAKEAREAVTPASEVKKSKTEVAFTEPLARRLLRLKMTMGETLDNIVRVMEHLAQGVPAITNDVKRMQATFDSYQKFLTPMIKFAGDYMRLPRQHRQGITFNLV